MSKTVTISIEKSLLESVAKIEDKADRSDLDPIKADIEEHVKRVELGKLAMKDTISPEDTGKEYEDGSYWCSNGDWSLPEKGIDEVVCLESPTITLTGTGLKDTPVEANVRISDQEANAIQVKDDGLHVRLPTYTEPDTIVVAEFTGRISSGESKILTFGNFRLNVQSNSFNDMYLVSLYNPGRFQTSGWQAWDSIALTTYNKSGRNETWRYADNISYGSQSANYFHSAIWDIDANETYKVDIFTYKPEILINVKVRRT